MSAWLRSRWTAVALGVLVVAFVAVALQQAAVDAPTVDESVDLSSGVTTLVRADGRMVPEHPIGMKVPAALPALLADPIVPRGDAYRRGDWFDHSDDFISANARAGRLRRVLFLGRLVPIAEAVACGLLMFVLARRLFGPGAGVLAAGLWFTTPFVVGLGHLLAIDVAFTLSTLAVALALWRHLGRPDWSSVAWLGAALAFGLTVRHSSLVLVAVAVAVVIGTGGRRRLRERAVQAAATVLVALAGVWVAYLAFARHRPTGVVAERFHGMIAAAGQKSALGRLALVLPMPLEWRGGLAQLVLTSSPRPSSAMGRSWVGSQWWYFPASLLVKVPLPTIALLLAGLWAWRSLPPGRRRKGVLAVVVPGLVLFLFTLLQPLDLGLRLVLPSLALWMVAASGFWRMAERARWVAAGLAVVAAVQVAAMGLAVPHSLAWTTPPFRPAYRWTSDSNVDYGQDIYRLRDWAEGRQVRGLVDSARGMETVFQAEPLLGVPPGDLTGWVVVGATNLTELQFDDLSWLRAYCPVDTVGGSILVYRFDSPPDMAPGPERPAAPCFGASASTR